MFEAAAKLDKNDWAHYAIATHSNTKAQCGRCYQIEYLPNCAVYWGDQIKPYGCKGIGCFPSTDDICKQATKDNPLSSCSEAPDIPLIVQNFNTGINCSQITYDCIPGESLCEEKLSQCDIKDQGQNGCSKDRYKTDGTMMLCKKEDPNYDNCAPFRIAGQRIKWDDVGGQFDIYMGLGGLGVFDGCTDREHTDENGDKWTGQGFYGGNSSNWPGERYGGATSMSDCEALASVPGFRGDKSDWNNEDNINFGQELIDSCKLSMSNRKDNYSGKNTHYHGNWAIKYKEVECPDNLIKTTGLALKNRSIGVDGKKLPKPSQDLLNKDALPGFTTTMMDCCKASCAWPDMYKKIGCAPNNNEIDPNWRSLYVVDHDGNRITRKDDINVPEKKAGTPPQKSYSDSDCVNSGGSNDPDVNKPMMCNYNNHCIKWNNERQVNAFDQTIDGCGTPLEFCSSCKPLSKGGCNTGNQKNPCLYDFSKIQSGFNEDKYQNDDTYPITPKTNNFPDSFSKDMYQDNGDQHGMPTVKCPLSSSTIV